MADKRNDLPDLTGIFDFDNSKIPKKVIARPAEPDKTNRDSGPILLASEDRARKESPRQRERRVETERQVSDRKTRLKVARKKKQKKQLLLIAVAVAVIGVLILAVAMVSADKKKPYAEIASASAQNVEKSYTGTAAVFLEADANGKEQTVAILLENDYDVYGLAKGQKAELTLADGSVVTGVVTLIQKEPDTTGVIPGLMQLMPEATFSTASNCTVRILPDTAEGLNAGDLLPVRIVTLSSENALSVPAGAVFTGENGETFVWKYKSFGKQITRTPITVGITSPELCEITAGLEKGDKVAYRFTKEGVALEGAGLNDGSKIKIAEPPAEETQQDPQ